MQQKSVSAGEYLPTRITHRREYLRVLESFNDVETSIPKLMSKHVTITKRVVQFCIQSSARFASPAAIACWMDSVHISYDAYRQPLSKGWRRFASS
jgi:antibiotic biosynthesis monooxygenase (ABM) superfamily enzyme